MKRQSIKAFIGKKTSRMVLCYHVCGVWVQRGPERMQGTGILCKCLGFGVFAKIFSKNIMIPSREIPFFGKAQQWFWVIIAKFRCILVSLGDPKNQITK
jgi:hypothetical protein